MKKFICLGLLLILLTTGCALKKSQEQDIGSIVGLDSMIKTVEPDKKLSITEMLKLVSTTGANTKVSNMPDPVLVDAILDWLYFIDSSAGLSTKININDLVGAFLLGQSLTTDTALMVGDGAGGLTETNVLIDSSDNVTGATSYSTDKVSGVKGIIAAFEANSTDTNITGFGGAPSIPDDMIYDFPNADPTNGQFWTLGATSGGVSQMSLKSFPVRIGVAVSDETTDLTTGTAKVTFRTPYAFTLTEVRSNVNTAPTGATLTVDLNEGGVSIFSTRPTIDSTEKTSTTAAIPAVISDSAIADDVEMTIDIDTIGPTAAGKGLKIWLIGTRIL